MKTLLASLIVLGLFATPGCGGDSHNSVANDMVDSMKGLATALEGIKDKASANAAIPKIESLSKKLGDLKKRGEKLPELNEASSAAMMNKHGQELQQHNAKIMTEMIRLAQIPEISEEMEKITTIMGEMGG